MEKQKPTIHELEKLLAEDDDRPIKILPDGSITVEEEFHQELRLKDAKDYRAKINHVKAERDRLREALEKISNREFTAKGLAPVSDAAIAKAALRGEVE